MERKKRSKGSVWEFCYANKFFGTFGDEIKAYGQKLVKFCAHTHTHTHTHTHARARAAKLVVEMNTNAYSKRCTVHRSAFYLTTNNIHNKDVGLYLCLVHYFHSSR